MTRFFMFDHNFFFFCFADRRLVCLFAHSLNIDIETKETKLSNYKSKAGKEGERNIVSNKISENVDEGKTKQKKSVDFEILLVSYFFLYCVISSIFFSVGLSRSNNLSFGFFFSVLS